MEKVISADAHHTDGMMICRELHLCFGKCSDHNFLICSSGNSLQYLAFHLAFTHNTSLLKPKAARFLHSFSSWHFICSSVTSWNEKFRCQVSSSLSSAATLMVGYSNNFLVHGTAPQASPNSLFLSREKTSWKGGLRGHNSASLCPVWLLRITP